MSGRPGGPRPTLLCVLYEDDIVDAVAAHLTAQGWVVTQALRAPQRGDDLIAHTGARRLIVEAKGETSSNPRSSRYGKAFDRTQVDVSTAEAVMRQLRLAGRAEDACDEDTLFAVAFPDTSVYRSLVDPAARLLYRVGLGIFWVTPATTVTLSAPWRLGGR
jgi:hypothetical protein